MPEDDESLLFIRGDCDDDASLSGHCSSLYLPGDETATAGEPLILGSAPVMARHRSPFHCHILQLQVAMDPQVLMEHNTAQRDQTRYVGDNDDADLSGHAVYYYGERSLVIDQRKCKQRKRGERSFEWLQSVQENKDVLAETASSKCLTGTSNRRRRRSAVTAKGERDKLAAAANRTANACVLLEVALKDEDGLVLLQNRVCGNGKTWQCVLCVLATKSEQVRREHAQAAHHQENVMKTLILIGKMYGHSGGRTILSRNTSVLDIDSFADRLQCLN